MSLAMAALLHTSLLTADATAYETAYQINAETGRPLLVLVGTDWCPGCRTMKQTVMPQVARRGLLDKVAYAEVNADQQGQLSRQLRSGSSIPELVLYWKTADGWHRSSLLGARSVSEIESFIERGLQAPTASLSSSK